MPAAPHSTRPLRHATNRSWQHTRRRPASLLIDGSLRPLSGHRIDAPPWDPKPRFSLVEMAKIAIPQNVSTSTGPPSQLNNTGLQPHTESGRGDPPPPPPSTCASQDYPHFALRPLPLSWRRSAHLPAREGTCPTVVHARAASSASISAAAFIATSCMLAAIRVRLGTCRHFRWVASLVPPCRTVVRRHWLARHHAHEAESGAARVGAGAPYR